MKTIKKLFVVILALVLTAVCFVSYTVSWYSHNSEEEGKSIHYSERHELSIKTDSIATSTVQCDKNGVVSDETAVETVSVAAKNVSYFKTTLKNPGSNDVMADLETLNLPNNADFSIGTFSPTVNEKAFASRPIRNKASDNKVRVYFKTNSSFSLFWAHGKDENGYNVLDLNNEGKSSNNTTCEINIAYSIGGTVEKKMMEKCPINDTNWDNTGTKVYYYDVPSNADYFFFFNKWYMKLAENDNRAWNCTLRISDMSPGKLFYLTGKCVNEAGAEREKEYASLNPDSDLVAVNRYYNTVRMSTGESVTADIGLKKDSDTEDEEFVPDYFGKSIAYSIKSGNAVSVNKDGLLMPRDFGAAVVQTTITGKFGDTRTLETTVNIPQSIEQVPIIKNVRIPAGGSVDVYWYARNNSNSVSLTTSSIIVTL